MRPEDLYLLTGLGFGILGGAVGFFAIYMERRVGCKARKALEQRTAELRHHPSNMQPTQAFSFLRIESTEPARADAALRTLRTS